MREIAGCSRAVVVLATRDTPDTGNLRVAASIGEIDDLVAHDDGDATSASAAAGARVATR